ncbi:MAG: hypothetical protein GF332_01670 [Candidatus Moranbacteria bacterium]|nr:hypothetical protein [Candidatus Moranbacteria bacterium]
MTKKKTKTAKKASKKKNYVEKTWGGIKKIKFPAITLINLLMLIIGGFIILNLIVAFGIYFWGWNNAFTQNISGFFSYPVVIIDRKTNINYKDYQNQIETLRRYHNLQSVITNIPEYDLSGQTGVDFFQVTKKNILKTMIEDKIIEKINQERYNYQPSRKEIQAEAEKIANLNSGQIKTEQKLEQIYDMDFDRFQNQIVKKYVQREFLKQSLIDQGLIVEQAGAADQCEFNCWLNQELKKHEIIVLPDQYIWDQKTGRLYFKNTNLNEYEQTVYNKN